MHHRFGKEFAQLLRVEELHVVTLKMEFIFVVLQHIQSLTADLLQTNPLITRQMLVYK